MLENFQFCALTHNFTLENHWEKIITSRDKNYQERFTVLLQEKGYKLTERQFTMRLWKIWKSTKTNIIDRTPAANKGFMQVWRDGTRSAVVLCWAAVGWHFTINIYSYFQQSNKKWVDRRLGWRNSNPHLHKARTLYVMADSPNKI